MNPEMLYQAITQPPITPIAPPPPIPTLETAVLPAMHQVAGAATSLSISEIGMYILALVLFVAVFEVVWSFFLARR